MGIFSIILYIFRYVIEKRIGETDASVFAILDGHGGEYAAVFAKDHLMERLRKKIEDAINIATGKVTPPSPYRSIQKTEIKTNTDNEEKPHENDDNKNIDDVKKSPNIAAERRNKFKKTMSTDVDCNPEKSNCNREQDAFLNKLSSVRLTRESFLKTNNKNIKPQEFTASHYVDRENNINFGKMISDLVLLTDHELVEQSKKQVKHFLATHSVS